MKAIAPVVPVAVELIDGHPTTTSLDVAAHFGKRHDDVLKRLRNLDCSPEFTLRNFAERSRPGSNNKPEPYYRMTRDGFTFLCMGFTGKEAAKWKEAYINAFNQLEQAITEKSNQPATKEAVIEQRAFRGHHILITELDGKTWLSAGNLCSTLNLGSSDRLVRSLAPQHKRKLRRGNRELWIIDIIGAERAADYCRAELAGEYREWLRHQFPKPASERPTDAPSLMGRRWLISFDHSGKEQIRPIPEDAGVMTLREMLSAVSSGDLLLSTEELFQLSAALLHRIEQRTTNEGQQLRELQQRVVTVL
ncbi:Rha family transcriptional regulator [Pseudomonas monteilii]|uniref:Rha family transcriptional regulator n=1 Tax=Pseudomonas monteilii TaxID=76759 RepID=UPI0015FD96E0|nr:Rha family transcriptional regulator [Pseudomonas monteilii]MBA6137558.1 Rha family transcriptional regulator [Pseudomonas monteilii]